MNCLLESSLSIPEPLRGKTINEEKQNDCSMTTDNFIPAEIDRMNRELPFAYNLIKR